MGNVRGGRVYVGVGTAGGTLRVMRGVRVPRGALAYVYTMRGAVVCLAARIRRLKSRLKKRMFYYVKRVMGGPWRGPKRVYKVRGAW